MTPQSVVGRSLPASPRGWRDAAPSEASFRGTGLRATQFTLLATLIQTGPLPMSALAGRLGLERTTLTRNLQLLEKRGLVAVAGDEDQRVRRVAVTRKGEAAATAALPAWKRAQASAGAVLRRSGVGVSSRAQAG